MEKTRPYKYPVSFLANHLFSNPSFLKYHTFQVKFESDYNSFFAEILIEIIPKTIYQ